MCKQRDFTTLFAKSVIFKNIQSLYDLSLHFMLVSKPKMNFRLIKCYLSKKENFSFYNQFHKSKFFKCNSLILLGISKLSSLLRYQVNIFSSLFSGKNLTRVLLQPTTSRSLCSTHQTSTHCAKLSQIISLYTFSQYSEHVFSLT